MSSQQLSRFDEQTYAKLKKLAREIEYNFERGYYILNHYAVIKGGDVYDNDKRHKNR